MASVNNNNNKTTVAKMRRNQTSYVPWMKIVNGTVAMKIRMGVKKKPKDINCIILQLILLLGIYK